MTKKSCELCKNPARMFCESDQASLCWDCDEKVHAANFLVAKHSRTLLCHVCYSPTAWKAAGARLGPTVSICYGCAGRATQIPDLGERVEGVCDNSQESESDDGEYCSESEEEDCSEEEEEEEEDGEGEGEEEDGDGDGENQVVPWTAEVSFTASVAGSSSATGEEDAEVSFKRIRDYATLSEDDDVCWSSQNLDSKMCVTSDRLSYQYDRENYGSSGSIFLRPLKMRRTSNHGPLISPNNVSERERALPVNLLSGTAAIVDKLLKFQQLIVTEEGDASAMILDICKLTRDS